MRREGGAPDRFWGHSLGTRNCAEGQMQVPFDCAQGRLSAALKCASLRMTGVDVWMSKGLLRACYSTLGLGEKVGFDCLHQGSLVEVGLAAFVAGGPTDLVDDVARVAGAQSLLKIDANEIDQI